MLAIGLAMLLTAAHVIIPGTISIAHYLRIPAHVVAVLLIAAGTSAPELVVAVQAALNGPPEIVWGNIFGSNIFFLATKMDDDWNNELFNEFIYDIFLDLVYSKIVVNES